MSLQRLTQRVDPTRADEGHQHINTAGGANLCNDLMTDSGLARSICEERGIEQWNKRTIDRLR